MTAIDTEVVERAAPAPAGTRHAVRAHVPALAGQAAAGAGNLVFAVFAAKLLGPDDYSDVVAFLALYLLLHVPASALSAAGALAPDRVGSVRTPVLRIGIVVGG